MDSIWQFFNLIEGDQIIVRSAGNIIGTGTFIRIVSSFTAPTVA